MTSATRAGRTGRAHLAGTDASPPTLSTSQVNRIARPRRAVLRLHARLLLRGTVLMAIALAVYVGLEIASYGSAYPEGVSPEQFAMFEDNPAVRLFNGVPNALDTAGGFAIWDAGWLIQLMLAVWAVLTTTRFLRGEEDVARAELVLAAPIRSTVVAALALSVMGAATLLVGAVVAVALVVAGEPAAGSVLLGLAFAGVGATFAGVAGVTSQLIEVRRRAAAWAAGVVGLAYVLRMVGNSAEGREWVLWGTPLGWLDQLRPYGEADLRALLPLLAAPFVLAGAAVALRARRDTGAGLISPDSTRQPSLRMLSSPLAFAWRSNRAVLLGWILGLGGYSVVLGALVGTMIDWLATDEGYQRIMASLGLDQATSIKGFLGIIALMLGLGIALQASWRIGAARAEEESGRIEAILARPVSRLRWLGGHVLLALLADLALTALLGSMLWVGAAAAGSSEITWYDTIRAVLNQLPVAILVGGLAVLTFGALPRLTVVVPVTVALASFVLSMLGPALDWPQWVLNVSPFTHLAMVPAEPWAALAGIVMTGLGVALGAAGLEAFQRRDVVTN